MTVVQSRPGDSGKEPSTDTDSTPVVALEESDVPSGRVVGPIVSPEYASLEVRLQRLSAGIGSTITQH